MVEDDEDLVWGDMNSNRMITVHRTILFFE